MNSDLKRIDFSKSYFVANGTRYEIKNTLGIVRFQESEKLIIRTTFGNTIEQILSMLNQALVCFDKGKPSQSVAIIYNLTENLNSKIHNQTDEILRICALFCVTKDEDITTWEEEVYNKKIEDWRKEGIAMADFFTLAVNVSHSFSPTSSPLSQSTLKKTKEKKK